MCDNEPSVFDSDLLDEMLLPYQLNLIKRLCVSVKNAIVKTASMIHLKQTFHLICSNFELYDCSGTYGHQ